MFEAKGMKEYNHLLQDARANGRSIGPTHYLISPQPTTSRLGFKGRKPTKATLQYIAEHTTLPEVSARLMK